MLVTVLPLAATAIRTILYGGIRPSLGAVIPRLGNLNLRGRLIPATQITLDRSGLRCRNFHDLFETVRYGSMHVSWEDRIHVATARQFVVDSTRRLTTEERSCYLTRSSWLHRTRADLEVHGPPTFQLDTLSEMSVIRNHADLVYFLSISRSHQWTISSRSWSSV